MESSQRAGEAARTAAAAAAASAPQTPAAAAAQPEAGTGPSSPETTEAARIDEFRCICLMNARYHSTREAFLDTVHRWLMFGIIIFGASSVIDFWAKTTSGALAAIFGALDIVFDLSNRARAHALMKRRYFELLADVTEGHKDVTGGYACMHRISADEEPAYHALISASWNAAQEMVYGSNAEKYEIGWFKTVCKNLLRFEGSEFTLAKADR
jgi:hypothetical protein